MQNRIFYQKYKNSDLSNYKKLCSCYKENFIKISDNYSSANHLSLIALKTNGYIVYGEKLHNDLKIYYDSSTSKYYFVIKPDSTTHYISFINELPPSDASMLHNEYNETIDISGLNEITQINELGLPYKRTEISKDANTTLNYTSINLNQVYSAVGSVLLITCRRSSGVNATGLYLLHKDNESNTSGNYSVTALSDTNVSSTFTITATSTGVDLLSAGACKYKIIEIGNGLPL